MLCFFYRKLWSSVKTMLKRNKLAHTKDGDNDDNREDTTMSQNELDEILDLSISDMSTLLSSDRERKMRRRSGISERNQTERLVVRKAVKNLVFIKHIKDIMQL